MKKLRVAIIGGGMIANSAHIPAYKNFSDRYDIVAVCDAFEKAAKDAAEKNSIPNYFTDAQEMLQKMKPDLVSVCAPNMLHKHFTMLALSHGANVICEKPLAFTLSDAKEISLENEYYVSEKYTVYHYFDEEGLITGKYLMSKEKNGGTAFK